MNEFHIKGSEKILSIIRTFSPTEKAVFGLLTFIALTSALVMAWNVNKLFMIPVPAHGGSWNEGVVGLPRNINPVLAFTEADRDLSTLVYSGLMKYDKGNLVPDIAEKYSVSDDGLVYSFTLRSNIRFHDGTPLTADDVEFTIQKIQDGTIKSPKRADWANIKIEKVSPNKINFILKQPYSPFLSNITVGILPKHIWKKVDADQFIFSQYNTEPIGSGPYKIDHIKKDSSGIPQYYTLQSFDRYYEGKPFISNINVYFYPNEKTAIEDYKSGVIEGIAGISPQEASGIASSTSSVKILNTSLPRIFGVFFNQNNAPVLANKEVRQALDMSVDKDKIVKEVLYGYGQRIDGPLPIGTIDASTSPSPYDKEAAKALLAKNGWLINSDGILEKKTKTSTQQLEFSISTSDAPDLKQTAEILKSEWESVGARVTVKIFEYGDLSQNIIKTRKYDALLFGEFIGKDLDLYAFWHSSQRNSPGLNIAMYVNSKADTLLESSRSNSNENQRESNYENFQKILKDDVPAIFLYSPEYIYLVSQKIQGLDLQSITNSSDRWYGINKWFVATDYIWKIFKT